MITLSKEGCKKNDVDIGEVLLLLSIHYNVNIEEAKDKLVKKGYITANLSDLFPDNKWRITRKGAEIINAVNADSDNTENIEERLTQLAIKLKEIFPKGKKDGTAYYWADGVAIIVRRLKLFFKKYGDIYTDEQIIKATEKYVQGYNGDYTYMKLLKYFILKDVKGAAGNVEETSELINYIENAGQEDILSRDWDLEVR